MMTSEHSRDHLFLILVAMVIGVAMLLTPTTSVSIAPPNPDYYKAAFVQTTLPLVLIAWLWYAREGLRFNTASILALIIALYMLLSLCWAFHTNLGQIAWSRFAAGVFTFWMLMQFKLEERTIHIALAILLGSTTLVALLGILQFFELPWVLQWIPQAGPPASTFGSRNVAMHVIILTIPLGFYFCLRVRSGPRMIASVSASLLLITYLFCSRNRTSMIAFALQLLAWIAVYITYRLKFGKTQKSYLSTSPLKNWIMLSAVALVVLVMIRLAQSLGGTSFGTRIILDYTTLFMIMDNPLLGVGIGNWKVFSPHYIGSHQMIGSMDLAIAGSNVLFEQLHNEYLQYLSELGLLGAIPMVLLLAVFAVWLLYLFRKDKGERQRLLWISLLIAFIGISANLGASFPLRVSVPILIMALYGAIVYQALRAYGAFSHKYSKVAFYERTVSLTLTTRVVISLLLVSASVGTAHTHRDWILAQEYRNMSAGLAISGYVIEAAAAARKSLEINPGDPDDALNILANVYSMLGSIDAAIEGYEHILKYTFPYQPYAYLNLGTAYLAKGDMSSYAKTMERAIEVMPLQSEYHIRLGDAYAGMGRIEASIQCYESAVAMDTPSDRRAQIERRIDTHRADFPRVSAQPSCPSEL